MMEIYDLFMKFSKMKIRRYFIPHVNNTVPKILDEIQYHELKIETEYLKDDILFYFILFTFIPKLWGKRVSLNSFTLIKVDFKK